MDSSHLSYCTNVHPAETLAEVFGVLEGPVAAVKALVSPAAPFGVGLRLSDRACRELLEDGGHRIPEIRGLLGNLGLYVFTLNGFIHGRFHGKPVKELVYRPAWSDPERLDYSNRLARILAALLPEGEVGSVSTVPVGFLRNWDEASLARASRHLLLHAAELLRIREETGRAVLLALEPEPGCFLERPADAVDFFERLCARDSLLPLAQSLDRPLGFCESLVREHIGICYDACHMAVVFEEPGPSLDRFARAGIGIFKIHASSALRLDFRARDAEIPRILAPFAEDVYLHQVFERCGDEVRSFADLPQALASLGQRSLDEELEWRVHFHVPLFWQDGENPFGAGRMGTTRSHLEDLLRLWRTRPFCPHLEVETYTWSVLPEELRPPDLPSSLAREIQWVRSALKDERMGAYTS